MTLAAALFSFAVAGFMAYQVTASPRLALLWWVLLGLNVAAGLVSAVAAGTKAVRR